MEQYLSVLEEKHRQIYLLRHQGLKFKEIAEKLSISSSTASKYYNRAVKLLKMAQWYQKKVDESSEQYQLTLTKGELQAITDSLLFMEHYQSRRGKLPPANEYQAQYQLMQMQSLQSAKKKLLIMLIGEEKYNRLPEV